MTLVTKPQLTSNYLERRSTNKTEKRLINFPHRQFLTATLYISVISNGSINLESQVQHQVNSNGHAFRKMLFCIKWYYYIYISVIYLEIYIISYTFNYILVNWIEYWVYGCRFAWRLWEKRIKGFVLYYCLYTGILMGYGFHWDLIIFLHMEHWLF